MVDPYIHAWGLTLLRWAMLLMRTISADFYLTSAWPSGALQQCWAWNAWRCQALLLDANMKLGAASTIYSSEMASEKRALNSRILYPVSMLMLDLLILAGQASTRCGNSEVPKCPSTKWCTRGFGSSLVSLRVWDLECFRIRLGCSSEQVSEYIGNVRLRPLDFVAKSDNYGVKCSKNTVKPSSNFTCPSGLLVQDATSPCRSRNSDRAENWSHVRSTLKLLLSLATGDKLQNKW